MKNNKTCCISYLLHSMILRFQTSVCGGVRGGWGCVGCVCVGGVCVGVSGVCWRGVCVCVWMLIILVTQMLCGSGVLTK